MIKINENLVLHSSDESKTLKFIYGKNCIWIILDLDKSIDEIQNILNDIKTQTNKVFVEIPQLNTLKPEHCVKLVICNISNK